MCDTLWPWPTMMPDRIGIIGKVQGVNASSRPKPKKLSRISGTLAPASRRAMSPVSSLETALVVCAASAFVPAAGAAGALDAAPDAPAPPPSTLSRKLPPDFFGGAVRSIEACCVVGG